MKTPSFVLGCSAIVAIASAPAGAAPPFGSNVCKLVTPAKIATIPGVSLNCTKAPATPGPGATIYTGNWPGTTSSSPHLQLTVAVYTDHGALQLATRNLKQGLPGPPHKVSGIGTAAWAGSGAHSAGVHFAVGTSIAYLTLTGPTTKTPSITAVEAIARSIVPLLRG